MEGGYVNWDGNFRGKMIPYTGDGAALNYMFNDPLAPKDRNYTSSGDMNQDRASAPLSIWAGNTIGPAPKKTTQTWPNGETVLAGDYNQNLTNLGGHKTRNSMENKELHENGYWAKSLWTGLTGEAFTGEVDHNYLFSDGSVKTYKRITWMDKRMTFHPYVFGSHFFPAKR
ncbi:hypothetical protein PQO01_14740 [Lentisphaera marina]|uniref:hypothetical protein n=1 Tax=Lentisphaera marina TaxID=1111041 RepID=UPI0023652D49|nr:hypothetical protein [Lentisphaera marina]MDD7986206.1 hypothetical protein [Lentisphaera marina]